MAFLRKMNETTTLLDEPMPTTDNYTKPTPKPTSKFDPTLDSEPLFALDIVADLRKRWDGVQAAFVDEPKSAVRDADELVAAAIKRLAESLGDARGNLEGQWSRNG